METIDVNPNRIKLVCRTSSKTKIHHAPVRKIRLTWILNKRRLPYNLRNEGEIVLEQHRKILLSGI